jgi:Holliday junction DNA helicase RuvA
VGNAIEFETLYYIEAGDKKSTHHPKLVGFLDRTDREFFSLLIQVPGLGVKKALKSLVLPIREIAAAIETKNSGQLSRLPGVGARQAEKIIAELHGKTARFALSRSAEPLAVKESKQAPFVEEALEVLLQLQYPRSDAEKMIDSALSGNGKIKTAEELIQVIFKTELGSKAGF